MGDIFERLETDKKYEKFAAKTLAKLQTYCPLSLHVIFEMIRTARISLQELVQRDVRVAYHFISGSEMYEGIAALLYDEERRVPKWAHDSVGEVPEAEVVEHFRILPEEFELKI